MMRVLKRLQDKATTGAGKKLVLPEPRRVRFLIRGEGPVSAGAVTIECCPESTKAGKFWMELATILCYRSRAGLGFSSAEKGRYQPER